MNLYTLYIICVIVTGRKVRKVTKLEKPPPQVFTDEVYYPRRVLEELSANGIDISSWKEARLMEGKNSARGATFATQWSELTNDGKIAVPYSFHSSVLQYEADIDSAMINLSKDLGCMEMVKVPFAELLTNSWANGIMFTLASLTGGGCWSALGLAPGFTGSNGDIELFGAKPEWQIISLDSEGCTGNAQPTLQHEVMHALGFYHEHQRPDRDDYITLHDDNIDPILLDQFTKLPTSGWSNSEHPFELGSVMTYCSRCGGNPAMTIKSDGTEWGMHGSVTTTDALQIQWHYCRNRPDFSYKNSVSCTSADRSGQILNVFTDRLCDNVKDCHGGEDEGTIAACKNAGGTAPGGCCNIIVIDSDECTYDREVGEKTHSGVAPDAL